MAAGWKFLAPRNMPRVRLLPTLSSLVLALVLILASNFGLARGIFISRSGSVFVFARLMQDGIVKRLLDERCTGPDTPYKLCAYKDHLAKSANGWLCGNNPGFKAQGGFVGGQVVALLLHASGAKGDT